MADFEKAFRRVMLEEGGFVLTNDPTDRGKQTYAGISRRFHPTWPGWKWIDAGDTPPTDLVRGFYREKFWEAVRGDQINNQSVAEFIYSMSVNAEATRKLVQYAIGVVPDGKFGPKTLAALNAIDEELFKLRFFATVCARYHGICKRDKTQKKYFFGWIGRALKGLK